MTHQTETESPAGRGRWAVWTAGLVVVVAAGAATAHGLYDVARGSGTTPGIAWLYPVITDGLALVAYAATTRLCGAACRYAWSVVVLAAGLSGLAQATYLAGSVGTAPPALRFGVGAWPAVAAAIAAHLLFLIGSNRTDRSLAGRPPTTRDADNTRDSSGCPIPGRDTVPSDPEPTDSPAEFAVRPELPAAPLVGRNPGMRRALSQTDRARTLAQLHAARSGSLPTVRELAEMADVGRGTADRALNALRAQGNGLHVIKTNSNEGSDQ